MGDAALRSPIDGVIADRKIEPGQLAAPGASVAQIVKLETVYFEAQVSEQDVSLVRQGQPVNVRLDAYPDRVFAGKIAKIFPTGSATARTFYAAVRIANSGGVLRPGLFARGEVVVERRAGSVTVPIEAVIRDPEDEKKARLFTVENGVARERNVTLGIATPDARRVEIRGVDPGASVVVVGQRGIKDSDRVTAELVDAATLSGDTMGGTGGSNKSGDDGSTGSGGTAPL